MSEVESAFEGCAVELQELLQNYARFMGAELLAEVQSGLIPKHP